MLFVNSFNILSTDRCALCSPDQTRLEQGISRIRNLKDTAYAALVGSASSRSAGSK